MLHVRTGGMLLVKCPELVKYVRERERELLPGRESETDNERE